MSTPFYDLNYSPSFNLPSQLDDSISSSIVLNSTRSDSSSSACLHFSIMEKNKDEYDREQEVEETNYLAQEDENKQQQRTLIGSHQQESTRSEGGEKFFEMGSVKWMSSKMRLMKKRMSSGQTMTSSPTNYNPSSPRTRPDSPQSSSDEDIDDDHSSSSSLTSKIRVCSDCNTTKTPLWRSGPKGPKSLCNACGIRQRKARRAMATTSGGLLAMKSAPSGRNSKAIKEKISTGQFKNGCRRGRPATKKKKPIRFDEFSMMSLSKISALNQYSHVFPQEEKEAAILLMALSYGSLLRS